MFALLLFVAMLSILFYNYYWKRRNLPPGPPPLPIVGNLLPLAIGGQWEKQFLRWRDQYGDVYTYWMGEIPVVSVTSYEKIAETIQRDGDAYAGRLKMEKFLTIIRGGNFGIITAWGDLWKEQRRFAQHVLRDFGLGKDLMQQRVLDEVTAMILDIKADVAAGLKEHDVPGHIDLAVGSVINSLLFGYRLRGEHEADFYRLKMNNDALLKAFGSPWTLLSIIAPALFKRLPLFKAHWNKMMSLNKYFIDFLERNIHEHQNHIDLESSSESTDYVEAFLREKARREKESGPHHFTLNQVMNACYDMWIAGQETPSTTLSWGLAYVLHQPEVQAKLQGELDRVVGSDRLITLADRTNLPYTCAVVNETQRLCNMIPMQNVIRETTRDVVIDGFHLPKGTRIVPQVSAILYDPNVFPEPTRFNPDRFIDEQGRLKRMDELIPFSSGKRQCLGEGLARVELFLFTANLFNHFEFSARSVLPSLRRKFGAAVYCPPYTCKVELRHHIQNDAAARG
ncbi:Protein CYP-33C1 [Aphelenchoides avenae]|nr:Protein CYP-33C1 [Aphelenchus avenae]